MNLKDTHWDMAFKPLHIIEGSWNNFHTLSEGSEIVPGEIVNGRNLYFSWKFQREINFSYFMPAQCSVQCCGLSLHLFSGKSIYPGGSVAPPLAKLNLPKSICAQNGCCWTKESGNCEILMHLEKVDAGQSGCTDTAQGWRWLANWPIAGIQAMRFPAQVLALKCARTSRNQWTRDENAIQRLSSGSFPLAASALPRPTTLLHPPRPTTLPRLPRPATGQWRLFYCSRIARIAPSCHLMGSRLPKPNNSFSAFLDSNFTNVPQLSESLITELPQ